MRAPHRSRRPRSREAKAEEDASRDSVDLHRQGKILRESDQEPHVAQPRSSEPQA